jgi:hypothetical protein
LSGDAAEADGRRRIAVASPAEAAALEARVRAAADAAARTLGALLAGTPALDVFRALKFRAVGCDPLDAGRPHNLLQQVHQTFAWLVAVRGVAHLLRSHPDHAPYYINAGTSAQPDIESEDGCVVAEVVAVVTPRNNGKLQSDLARLRARTAPLRYLFYYAEEDRGTVSDPDIAVVAIDLTDS